LGIRLNTGKATRAGIKLTDTYLHDGDAVNEDRPMYMMRSLRGMICTFLAVA